MSVSLRTLSTIAVQGHRQQLRPGRAAMPRPLRGAAASGVSFRSAHVIPSNVGVPGQRTSDPLLALCPPRPPCPRCGNPRVHRWGRYRLRPRYRCLACMRTFSPFTGSALHGLKRAELWPEFCRCMLEGESVRRTARKLGVHRDTAFRWRHRLLREIRAGETHPVGPAVNVGETHVVWGRWILVGLDDRGRALSASIGSRRADVRDVRACLKDRLERGATVATVEGKYGAVARFVRAELSRGSPLGTRQVRWRHRRHVDARYDGRIETVARFGFRLRRWLVRFRGIAPHYTDNYLAWFRLVDGSLWAGALRTGPRDRAAWQRPAT